MSEELTAISGTRRQYKEMADGTLRVQIDIDPQYKQRFLELFGSIDMPVALAPLKADFEQKTEPEKPKGGPLSKSAAQMCEYPPFQAFLREEYEELWYWFDQKLTPEVIATGVLRNICKIDSRAKLDHNPDAAQKFRELMREFNQWRGLSDLGETG
jgi:hypothetical protein